MPRHDESFLKAALVGYEQERERIERAIAEIRQQLGIPGLGPLRTGRPVVRRRISPEGRKRIADAQRRRWAAKKKRR